jgi:hypothetical protein
LRPRASRNFIDDLRRRPLEGLLAEALAPADDVVPIERERAAALG